MKPAEPEAVNVASAFMKISQALPARPPSKKLIITDPEKLGEIKEMA